MTIISYYDSLTSMIPTPIPMRDFLANCTRKALWRKEVEALRASATDDERSRLKKRLPAVTISARYEGRRKPESLKTINPYICIDIDAKDNPSLDIDAMKRLADATGTAMATLTSCSGRGVFCICPVRDLSYVQDNFLSLREYFGQHGLKIDKACRDTGRLRYVTYDPQPRFNSLASPLDDRIFDHVQRHEANAYHNTSQMIDASRRRQQCQCADTGTDIVSSAYDTIMRNAHRFHGAVDNYDDWLRLGFACASEGEKARKIFTLLSSLSAGYKPEKINAQYDDFLRDFAQSRSGFTHVLALIKKYR